MNHIDSKTLPYPIQNKLLSQLSTTEYTRLAPFLQLVALSTSTQINSSQEQIEYAYFPLDSIISLFKVDHNGNANQIAMVGNEGMIGISMFSNRKEPFNAAVQAEGIALRIKKTRLVKEFKRHEGLFDAVFSYLQLLLVQVAQTAICNRLHTIEQQLCRWLLLTLERLPSNHIKMTQERISLCLGVRRESITESASKLHQLGIIDYSRGNIKIIDMSQLEALSCDCYQSNHSPNNHNIIPIRKV